MNISNFMNSHAYFADKIHQQSDKNHLIRATLLPFRHKGNTIFLGNYLGWAFYKS